MARSRCSKCFGRRCGRKDGSQKSHACPLSPLGSLLGSPPGTWGRGASRARGLGDLQPRGPRPALLGALEHGDHAEPPQLRRGGLAFIPRCWPGTGHGRPLEDQAEGWGEASPGEGLCWELGGRRPHSPHPPHGAQCHHGEDSPSAIFPATKAFCWGVKYSKGWRGGWEERGRQGGELWEPPMQASLAPQDEAPDQSPPQDLGCS